MAMVNLKNDPKESDKSTMLAPAYEEPAYPYGLQILLCDDVLEKLGMELPTVGGTVTFTAVAKVVSVSQYEEAKADADTDDKGGSSVDRSVSLQITDMDMGAKPSKLYA